MKRFLGLAAAGLLALSLSGCALFQSQPGGPTLTTAQKLDLAKGALAFAHTGVDTICAQTATAKPHFCGDPASRAQIDQIYTDAIDAIDAAQGVIAAGDDKSAQLQALVDKAVGLVADYQKTVDSFKRS